MADSSSKTQQKTATQAPPVEMAEDRMPDGQAPAVHDGRQQQGERRAAPPSAMQRAATQRAARMSDMVAAIDSHRQDIEAVLRAMRIPFDVFRQAVIVGLKNTLKGDPDFFEKVSVASYFEAVQRAVKDGLLPDGKQCAIARFLNEAAYLPMIEGYCKILFDTGLVKDINHGVVLEGEHFAFMQGSDPWVEHQQDLDGDAEAPDAKIVAAWCFVTTTDGGKFLEITPKKTLERVAKVSRATKGPRQSWGGEMHRKTPFRRLVKRLPKHPRLDSLIAHEDSNVDLERPVADTPDERRHQAARTMGNDELFSDTRASLPAPEADEGERPDAQDYGEPDVDSDGVEDQAEATKAIADIRGAGDSATLASVVTAWQESDAFKRASEDTRSWVKDAASRRADEIGGLVDEPALRAIISSTQKEPKVYDDPALWKADILTKLDSLKADQVGAFWKRNAAFIATAEAAGVEQAGEVKHVFAAKGVNVGAPA